MSHRSAEAGPGNLLRGLDPESEALAEILESMDGPVSIHKPAGEVIFGNRRFYDRYDPGGSGEVEAVAAEIEGEFKRFSVADALAERASVEYEVGVEEGIRPFKVMVTRLGGPGQARGFIRVMKEPAAAGSSVASLVKEREFATLGYLISGITHDIGTPLNIISGYTEYLLIKSMPGMPGHKELSTILQQTRRIAELIRYMLDLARPSQEWVEMIDLRAFLEKSIDLVGHHFRKAEVGVSVGCDAQSALVSCDVPRLRRTFFNVLLFALEKVGAGGKIEVVVGQSPVRPESMMIKFFARGKSGDALDLATDGPGRIQGGMNEAEASEVLSSAGMKVEWLVEAGRGKTIAICL